MMLQYSATLWKLLKNVTCCWRRKPENSYPCTSFVTCAKIRICKTYMSERHSEILSQMKGESPRTAPPPSLCPVTYLFPRSWTVPFCWWDCVPMLKLCVPDTGVANENLPAIGVPTPVVADEAAWKARRCFGVEYKPLVGGPPVAALSADGVLVVPGVEVCGAGEEGVKKPFARFCWGVGVCGVPVAFWLNERFSLVGELLMKLKNLKLQLLKSKKINLSEKLLNDLYHLLM